MRTHRLTARLLPGGPQRRLQTLSLIDDVMLLSKNRFFRAAGLLTLKAKGYILTSGLGTGRDLHFKPGAKAFQMDGRVFPNR